MGFNYAIEKKKFDRQWAELRLEYQAAGMSDSAIEAMHDYDWEIFKQERIYRLHTQEFVGGSFNEDTPGSIDKSPLMEKFLVAVSCWDDYSSCSRYAWIEQIEDSRLSKRLKTLSLEDMELLTKYCIEERTQCEIANELGLSQRAVSKRVQAIKKFLK